jgi:hypothetical protein
MSLKLESFDQPLIFSLAITFVVLGWIAILSWVFVKLNWTGPLGLVKGGVVHSS